MLSHYYAMLFRMKYINRWLLMRNMEEESLSVHSIETAFIAHALAVIENKRLKKNVNAERAALLAMFHDTPEIITGDLPTPVKYYNPKIKSAYGEIEETAVKKLLEMIPEDLREEYAGIYNETDEHLLQLIHAADKLSALIKCRDELKLGNSEFSAAEKATLASIKALNLEAANIFIDEFLDSFSLPLDEQGLL